MPEGWAVIIFGILAITTIYLDDRLSYKNYPTEFRQAWYTIWLGFALKWGYDLVMNKDWGDLMMIGLVVLLFVGGLIATIRNKRIQNINEQNYMLGILSDRISKSVKDAVKEALKEDREEQQSKNTTQKK